MNNSCVTPFFQVGEIATAIASVLSENVKRDPSKLQINWVELLARYQWHWFATFTFHEETHPEAASKVFRHWTNVLDESNGYRPRSKSTHARRCTWARGLEWQKRGVIHFHALLGNIPLVLMSRSQRELWQERWFDLGNTGIARIHAVDTLEGAAAYVTKYCVKGGEIDISPSLQVPDLVSRSRA